MMEKLVIDSATTDVEGKHKDYSEWRLCGLGGSSFHHVVVNEGFHSRDFQTRQGAVSVIDPEVLGKLCKEALTIMNNSIRWQLAVFAGFYLCCALLFLGLHALGVVTDDVFFFGMIVTLGIVLFLASAANTYLRKNDDARLTALVESYQPIFLEEFGVEIGYDGDSLSPKGGWFKIPGIYLRRPRRVVEDEEALVGGDSEDLDRFPPIYLARSIPGDIHIDEKEYDVASMKVDAETWSLLQSTHQKMIQWQWHPMMKFLAFLSLLWVGQHFHCGILMVMIVGAVVYNVGKVYDHAVDKRNLKAYEEVTKVVNEALQKDEKTANVAVEFHTSEVPCRERKGCRRYQFVQLDSGPTKELV